MYLNDSNQLAHGISFLFSVIYTLIYSGLLHINIKLQIFFYTLSPVLWLKQRILLVLCTVFILIWKKFDDLTKQGTVFQL